MTELITIIIILTLLGVGMLILGIVTKRDIRRLPIKILIGFVYIIYALYLATAAQLTKERWQKKNKAS